MKSLVLGDPENVRREELLRGGAIAVRSRRGLRTTERLLVEALPATPPSWLVSGLDTEGAVALAARALWGPGRRVTSFHLDAYLGEKVRGVLARNGAADVEVLVAPDLPGALVPGEPPPPPDAAHPDLIALPFPSTGEALLGRELIEEAHATLPPGGRLLAATDNPKGAWLRKVVKEVFGRVSLVREEKGGVCVAAKRVREKAVVRDHRHVTRLSVSIRGNGPARTIELETRPGTFGHARIDAGTKALIERLEVAEDARVLDLGCGYGPIGLAAAAMAPAGEAVLVDSNPRATTLAARNAARNGLANVRVLLRANLEALGDRTFEQVLANPPYFSNFRIARAFVACAAQVLRPGGRLAMVVKAADEHAKIARDLGHVTVEEAPGGYAIVRAVKI